MFEGIKKFFTPGKTMALAAGAAFTAGVVAGPDPKDMKFPTPAERQQYQLDSGEVNQALLEDARSTIKETDSTIEAFETPGLKAPILAAYLARSIKETQKLIRNVADDPEGTAQGSKAPAVQVQLNVANLLKFAKAFKGEDEALVKAKIGDLEAVNSTLTALFGKAH